MARILVVDDEPKMTSLVCGALEDEGYTVETCTDPRRALDLIEHHAWDIVVTDLSMPEVSGMDVLRAALAKEPTEVIMMTAYGTVETAVEAMKAGAADYLLKPFSLDELVLQVKKLLSQQKTESLKGHYEQELRSQTATDFIGSSDAAEQVRRMIRQVASTDTTVLLTGRSGTGKELAARMIHEHSPRREHPFIPINCAAITETLLESELFGHEKGAFTGASERKQGRFELADGGTLFLDEIGEMSPGMQSKLLRVLEEHTVVRVGGVDPIGVNVRVVAATNRELKEQIKTGNFREDLYFRLNVFPIRLPNLVERGADVIELAEHFLEVQQYAQPELDEEVKGMLRRYDWPGNVRELRNVIERAMILAGGEQLTVDDFSLEVDDAPIVRSSGADVDPSEGLEAAEKRMIVKALEETDGNKTDAAALLKISRRRLYSRMKVHGIEA